MDNLFSQACFVSFVENAKLDPGRTGSFYSPVFGHLFSMVLLTLGLCVSGIGWLPSDPLGRFNVLKLLFGLFFLLWGLELFPVEVYIIFILKFTTFVLKPS